jgi:DNA mismatch repair protein MutS
MDEIGRGTSTYDGISIAWSVAEYLVENPVAKPLTLFATHYHELQNLEERFPDKIKNYQITVAGTNTNPVFVHKVKRGGADHSFGIAVARLAGVPEEVCKNAETVLIELKERASKVQRSQELVSTVDAVAAANDNDQKQLDPLITRLVNRDTFLEKLNKIDIGTLTPLEAINILAELKQLTDVQD